MLAAEVVSTAPTAEHVKGGHMSDTTVLFTGI